MLKDMGVKSHGVQTPTNTTTTCVTETNKRKEGMEKFQPNIATGMSGSNGVTDEASKSNQFCDGAHTRTIEKTNDSNSILATNETNELTKTSDGGVPEENTEPTAESKKLDESTQSAPPLRAPVKKRSSQLGSMARKKRKSQLAEMSAAVSSAPAKLNTLEKSKLDWEAFKGNIATDDNRGTMSAAERDELDSQTQGGGSGLGDVKGYLHRKEFLERVHGRLDQQEYENHISR